MAAIGVDPVQNTPAAARRALERDLPRVLRGRTLEEAGWRRPDDLTLLVPMQATREDGGGDDFLLRLNFGYYPDWPPSALFVNPETDRYEYPADAHHLPRIEGSPEIQVHKFYNSNGQYPVGQLICASVTLEFYIIRHQVQQAHLWDAGRQTFAATINAISHWMKPPYYKGRQEP